MKRNTFCISLSLSLSHALSQSPLEKGREEIIQEYYISFLYFKWHSNVLVLSLLSLFLRKIARAKKREDGIATY
jgi:hypothetical protein